MKFDFVIGNPPYQEQSENSRANPVYNRFMDSAYEVSDCVELITPARFLFDAGQTPKDWNKKILSDPHFKVIKYVPDASSVFSNTEIKGGVAITIRDQKRDFGAIGVFTENDELNQILRKVQNETTSSLSDICVGAVPYRYTEKFTEEHPEWVDLAGNSFDLRTNAFDNLENKIFFHDKPDNGERFVGIFGILRRSRVTLWVKSKYINGPENFKKYKVLLPKANGAGSFGEPLAKTFIAKPMIGHTQSFISLGSFDKRKDAVNLESYIKTKFCRCLLGVLKKTQDITPSKWKYVPNQNFSDESDINWNTSISSIDKQLYKKYKLTSEQVSFIDSNVSEME